MRTVTGWLGMMAMLCSTSPAMAEENWQNLFHDGKWLAQMRIRYEFVEEDGMEKNAHARTMRLSGGYETGSYYGFSAVAEAEWTAHLGHDAFNDGINGRTDYPQVIDPDGVGINRMFLRYAGWDGNLFVLGRFKLGFDNERFIGQANIRQNDMSYDGFLWTNQVWKNLRLDYAYVNQVNRPSGPRSATGVFKGDSHFAHATYRFSDNTGISAYGYLLGFDDFAVNLASQSYGLRLDGAYPLSADVALLYTLEGAVQKDYGDNPNNYTAYYMQAFPGIGVGNGQYRVGYDVLTGDGANSFRTPLSSIHVHNGWADMFITTPPEGLRDIYLNVDYRVPLWEGTRVVAQLHDFTSDNGAEHYGTEWGIAMEKQLTPRWVIGAKYADYNAKGFAVDTVKAWFYAQYTY